MGIFPSPPPRFTGARGAIVVSDQWPVSRRGAASREDAKGNAQGQKRIGGIRVAHPGTAVPRSPGGGAPLVDEQNLWKRKKSAGLAVGLTPVSR